MIYFVVLLLAIGFGLVFVAIVGAIAQSWAIRTALESIARQPEAAGPIQMAMVIGLAMIESLVIYTLVMSFFLLTRLPPTDKIIEILSKTGIR